MIILGNKILRLFVHVRPGIVVSFLLSASLAHAGPEELKTNLRLFTLKNDSRNLASASGSPAFSFICAHHSNTERQEEDFMDSLSDPANGSPVVSTASSFIGALKDNKLQQAEDSLMESTSDSPSGSPRSTDSPFIHPISKSQASTLHLHSSPCLKTVENEKANALNDFLSDEAIQGQDIQNLLRKLPSNLNSNQFVNFLEQLANQGHPAAQSYFGETLLLGLCGKTEDTTRAVAYFRKAAKQKDAVGLARYGEALRLGLGNIEVDEESAIEHFKEASRRGSSFGMLRFGEILMFGIHNKHYMKPQDSQNSHEAVELFKKSAAKENLLGMVRYGEALLQGLGGLDVNEEEAVRLFEVAADFGNSIGMLYYGEALRFEHGGKKQNPSLTVEYYKKAADKGNLDGLFQLAKSYLEGYGMDAVDETTGLRLLKEAARQGHLEAMSTYGEKILCKNNQNRASKIELLEAINLIEMSADNGNLKGLVLYGEILLKGIGRKTSDPILANYYFNQARRGG